MVPQRTERPYEPMSWNQVNSNRFVKNLLTESGVEQLEDFGDTRWEGITSEDVEKLRQYECYQGDIAFPQGTLHWNLVHPDSGPHIRYGDANDPHVWR